jgi:AsmA protein
MILNNKKVLFIMAGAITLVVIAIILALLLSIQAFKPQIEAAASAALGMDVRVKGRMGIDLFPGLGLSLKDADIRSEGLSVVRSRR